MGSDIRRSDKLGEVAEFDPGSGLWNSLDSQGSAMGKGFILIEFPPVSPTEELKGDVDEEVTPLTGGF